MEILLMEIFIYFFFLNQSEYLGIIKLKWENFRNKEKVSFWIKPIIRKGVKLLKKDQEPWFSYQTSHMWFAEQYFIDDWLGKGYSSKVYEGV